MNALLCCIIAWVALPAAAFAQSHIWSQTFGDEWPTRATSVCSDASGNFIIVGGTGGAPDFGGGPLSSGAYLLKLDSDGQHLWSANYGVSNVTLSGVATDQLGNIYVSGSFSDPVDFGGGTFVPVGALDAFLVKFDPSGSHTWSMSFGDDEIAAWRVVVSEDNRVAIVGRATGSYDFGGGTMVAVGESVFVACFDLNGSHLFSGIYGDASPQSAGAAAFTPGGQLAIGGGFRGSVDFGGGALVAEGSQWSDAFLAMFDASGTHVWSARYGDASHESVWGLDCDTSGNVVATGGFDQTIDLGGGVFSGGHIFAAKFDGQGHHVWSREYGSSYAISAFYVAAAPDGGVVLGGLSDGNVDFGGGVFSPRAENEYVAVVAKLDAGGLHEWSAGFQVHDLRGVRIASDPLGSVLLAGEYYPNINLGGGVLTVAGGWQHGQTDLFAAKLAPAVVPTKETSLGALKRLFGSRE